MSPIAPAQTPDLWVSHITTAYFRPLHEESTARPIIVPLAQSFGRFDHLELGQYKETMLLRDFDFFVAFAGGDTLGFTEEDLETFYPPEG